MFRLWILSLPCLLMLFMYQLFRFLRTITFNLLIFDFIFGDFLLWVLWMFLPILPRESIDCQVLDVSNKLTYNCFWTTNKLRHFGFQTLNFLFLLRADGDEHVLDVSEGFVVRLNILQSGDQCFDFLHHCIELKIIVNYLFSAFHPHSKSVWLLITIISSSKLFINIKKYIISYATVTNKYMNKYQQSKSLHQYF